MAQTAAATTGPDYGQDAPVVTRHMFSRAVWTLLFAIVLFYINAEEYPGPAARMAGVIAVIALGFGAAGFVLRWYSATGKLEARDQILDSLNLAQAERVLDVGTGRALYAIGAAKRLPKGGRVTGIDSWDPPRRPGNTLDAARENAKREGVSDKIRLEPWDPHKLPYPDGHFDAVVSSFALHHVTDGPDRTQAMRELLRVLKPGGKIAIHGCLGTGEYARTLAELGARDISHSPWSLRGRVVTAQK